MPGHTLVTDQVILFICVWQLCFRAQTSLHLLLIQVRFASQPFSSRI